MMWYDLFKYTGENMGWGFWVIFFSSWMGSFCVVYTCAVGQINDMLYGKSAPVSLTDADFELEEVHHVQNQFQ